MKLNVQMNVQLNVQINSLSTKDRSQPDCRKLPETSSRSNPVNLKRAYISPASFTSPDGCRQSVS